MAKASWAVEWSFTLRHCAAFLPQCQDLVVSSDVLSELVVWGAGPDNCIPKHRLIRCRGFASLGAYNSYLARPSNTLDVAGVDWTFAKSLTEDIGCTFVIGEALDCVSLHNVLIA